MLVNRHNKSLAERRDEGSAARRALHRTGAVRPALRLSERAVERAGPVAGGDPVLEEAASAE